MPRTILLTILALLFVSCATPIPSGRGTMPTFPVSPLAARIDALIPDSLSPPASVGILVVRLPSGAVVYERNAQNLYTPASNQKLLTTAAALTLLGPSALLETRVLVDHARRTIFLQGGGDGLLMPEDLDTLAAQLLLDTAVAWRLAGDAARFDTVYWGKGWMWDDAYDPTGMAVSALSVNGNVVDVHLHADEHVGAAPIVSVLPSTPSVRIINRAVIVDSVRVPLQVRRPLQHQSNDIVITGEMRTGRIHHEAIAIWEPERFTLSVFREALRSHGIRCGEATLEPAPAGLPVAALVSHRLDSTVVFINRTSDNLGTESLVKLLGARGGEPGSWENGLPFVRAYLSSIGIDTLGMTVADGSGLSRYNLASPVTMVRVLTAMYHSPFFPLFFASLPGAGEEGTLSRRMLGTPAEHRLRAKTGTETGVTTLAGYTIDARGDTLAFSIMMQGFPGTVRPYRAIQDSIGSVLSGPPLP